MSVRELKFRVWDEYIMWEEDIALINGSAYTYDRNEHRGCQLSCISKGIVMQYTGLKDRNGVAIYEGDICTLGYKDGAGVVKFGVHDTSTDYYCDTAYGFFLETKEGDTFNLSYYGEIVIGNIYENPELMESK